MSYPNVRVKKAEKDAIEIGQEVLVSVPPSLSGFAELRTFGEFEKKAIFLNNNYVWILGLDNEGVVVAIPTRRS